MSVRRANRVDHGQAEIVELIRKAGQNWVPCVPPFPCDGIAFVRAQHDTHVIFCEVKDGTKSPSARRLTPNELQFKALCDAQGVNWWLLESTDDALRMINYYRQV